jgi:PAS domain S-box-containing protein
MKGFWNNNNNNQKSIFLTILFILLLVFLIDVNFPSVRNFWLFFFIPILISVWILKSRFQIRVIVLLSSLLILAGYFIAPSSLDNFYALSNRLIGIIILAIYIFLLLGRKKAVESLEEREKQFYNTIMYNPMPMWIRTEDGEITLINNAVTNITGYTHAELPNVSEWVKKLYSENNVVIKKHINRMFTTGNKIDAGEFEITTKSGEKRLWNFNIAPLGTLPDGRKAVITTAFDLTERKKTEKMLAESEQKFRTIAESMPQIVWTATPDGLLDYMNSQGTTFAGIKATAEHLLNWMVLIHPDDLSMAKDFRQQSLATNQPFEMTYRMKKYTGEYYWFLTRAVPLIDESGKLVKWLGTSTDIHQQKEVQEKLSYTLLKLVENEEKLVEVQKITHVGSYAYNINNGNIEWSEEAYHILDIVNHNKKVSLDDFLNMIHPDEIEKVKKEFNKMISGSNNLDIEHRIILPDGTIKYLHKIGKPILDESGKVIKVIGSMTDITQQKLMQLKLEDTLKDLNRSNKDLEQFAYTVSHDLQEPIRMIKGYSQLLHERYLKSLDENARSFLNFIMEGAIRMQQLVSDLLRYSRITTKAVPFEEIDCNKIIRDTIADLKFYIEENDAAINCNNLPVITGDTTQIRQLFQNLIQNAIKFKGNMKPEIIIEASRKEDEYLFSITDNGIGIEKNSYERIFEIFQRLHEKSKYPGTGVGLAICKKIVERHGGNIWLESEPGKGSTFYFTIPIKNRFTSSI